MRDIDLGEDTAYLISDFPVTKEVLDKIAVKSISFLDDDLDRAEAFVLRELRMNCALLLPLVVRGSLVGARGDLRHAPAAVHARRRGRRLVPRRPGRPANRVAGRGHGQQAPPAAVSAALRVGDKPALRMGGRLGVDTGAPITGERGASNAATTNYRPSCSTSV